MTRERKVPITPAVLRWAIDASGYSDDEIAVKLKLHPSHLKHWLRGDDKPALTYFRELARLLRRPSATFFLPGPPSESLAPVQYRPAPGDRPRSLLPEEHVRLREAERLQRAVAWLGAELQQPEPRVPRVPAATSADHAAEEARALLAVTLQEQQGWSSPSTAQRAWRDAFERLGILVLSLPMGARAARGFSIWHERAPLIAVNTHWNAAARVFTMLHELGHLMTRTSSICAELGRRRRTPPGADIERWCERFAAGVLMPGSAVEDTLAKAGIGPRESITNLKVATRVAAAFHVSLRTAVLRLIALERSNWSLYANLQPASDAKRGGGGGGRSRTQARLDEYGSRVTRTFVLGMNKEILSASEVMRYLDVPYAALGELQALAS